MRQRKYFEFILSGCALRVKMYKCSNLLWFYFNVSNIVLNELNIQMKKRRMHSVKIITFALNNICVIKKKFKIEISDDILIILIII